MKGYGRFRISPFIICALLLVGCGHASQESAKDYEFSFQQAHPATGIPTYDVHIYLAVGPAGQVQRIYSITLAPPDKVLYETSWNSATPSVELARDWVRCDQTTAIPEPIPGTIPAMEASVLGPLKPPPGATILGSHVWQVRQGIDVLTVHEYGSGITERVVARGLPGKGIAEAGTVISGALLASVRTIPGLHPGWGNCQPSPRLIRPSFRPRGKRAPMPKPTAPAEAGGYVRHWTS